MSYAQQLVISKQKLVRLFTIYYLLVFSLKGAFNG